MAVRCIDHCWIPMPDGARLGARIWFPQEASRYPAILEYIPYRKDDYTSLRDSTTIAHFAHHGYACIRVDMRGSGASDGVLEDEYSDQEIDDGVSVIEWIAAQPWCDGQVATMGISWGGVTGLQLAQRAPAALKTVIALGASDRRYYDDAGYYLGCMVGQTLGWAAIMFGYNTRPPDPELAGGTWRELWMNRLEQTPHYLERWFEHQHRDEYWQANSVDVDHAAIKIPVYAISGHVDCWPNTVPRLLQNLSAPVRGLQGAWCHRYPHLGIPGPTVDFLGDALRWFDQWMKNTDNGILDEARYQVFLQDSVKPLPFYEQRPGRWIGLPGWPSDQVETRNYFLGHDGLTDKVQYSDRLSVSSPQTVGLQAGEYMPWFAFGPADELPGDQQIEDAGSMIFDTAVLDADLEILGNPRVRLQVSSDQSQALVAARLCDVHADASSTLITRGILNLSQRHGKTFAEAMPVDEPIEIEIDLNHVGYVVPKGNRLRLALSTSYWPMAWPSPSVTTLSVSPQHSHLELPVLKADYQGEELTEFGHTAIGEADAVTTLRPVEQERGVRYEAERQVSVLEIRADNGKTRFERSGMEMGSTSLYRFSINQSDPLSATAEYAWEWEFGRGDWQVKTRTLTGITCDAENFYLKATSTAWEGDVQIFHKAWKQKYRRDHF